jgi:serine/threonine protein kinase
MKPYFHNLYLIVKKCKTLSFEERLSISYKISKGLCFLSSKGILHRDFKPHNIMLDHQFNPFIIDFGSCAPIYREGSFKVK